MLRYSLDSLFGFTNCLYLSDVCLLFNFSQARDKSKLNYLEARKRDHISHFLLRLYYCRTEELRKWFIWHETELLRHRLYQPENRVNISSFLRMNGLKYQVCSTEEREKMDIDCRDWYQFMSSNLTQSILTQELYKLPFVEALELVRHRRVYLRKGFAYIFHTEMISIICNRFKLELANMLAVMNRDLPMLEEDERLLPRLHTIHYENVTKLEKAQRDKDRPSNRELVTPDMIDELAKDSFPPCMRNMHENLRKNHHLKHYGRLHYGLFLKSIGLSLDDALSFFREEFIKTIAPEKFAKEYSYNIRYNYGKEGKKTDLSGFGCNKIITENPPGPGDSHGCPFRHFDDANLKAMLRRFGSNEEQLSEMMAHVEGKNYMSACTCFFATKHPNHQFKKGDQIYHPNQFHAESRRAKRGVPLRIAIENPEEEMQVDKEDEIMDDDDLDKITDEQLNDLTNATISKATDEQEKGTESVPEKVIQDAPESRHKMKIEENEKEDDSSKSD